jgi:hypothetical protein
MISVASCSVVTAGAGCNLVTIADVNRDGALDLVAADTTANDVAVLLGDGKGGFAAGMHVAVGALPQPIAISDFDGDGAADLAVACYQAEVSLVMGNGDGSFRPARAVTVGRGPASITAADLNGDGRLDLAFTNANSSRVGVLLGTARFECR